MKATGLSPRISPRISPRVSPRIVGGVYQHFVDEDKETRRDDRIVRPLSIKTLKELAAANEEKKFETEVYC